MGDDLSIRLPPDDPPDEDLSPHALHDRWERSFELSAEELREFKASEFNAAYREQNSSGAQPGNEPLDDAIRLAETPGDEWEDRDDGFNEVEEAREALDWLERHGAQAKSQGLGGNFLTDQEAVTKREASFIRWGTDPDGEQEW